MKRDFNPVDVELSIENPSIERGAFYRLCFITESDIAPRTLKVTRLQDLLDNGYSRLDLVYNFCVGVFSQQGIDTVYIRAKRSSESYVESYNSDDNSMYYFVVLQTKDLTEVEKFNKHLVSFDEMKLQFFSQNVGSKIFRSPKLVNYYQDYTLSGGASVDSKDYYLNKAYNGVTVVNKLPLPDYLLGGYGNTAVDYGVRMMVGRDYIWEIDKPNRQIRYARSVVESGWVGSREDSTVNGSEVTVVATKGSGGKLLRASIIDPKVKIETISRELLKGLGKEALDYAISLIDPEATDWVLDPDNNSIKYKNAAPPSTGNFGKDNPTLPEYYKVNYKSKVRYGATPQEAGTAACEAAGDLFSSYSVSSNKVFCKYGNEAGLVDLIANTYYDPSFDSEYKSIPIDTVAAKVIANAESGHTPSQEALRLSTVERVDIGEYDEALEAASTEIDTSWKYLPIYDVAVQVKRNSIAGHAESIEAVNNSLPFELPNYEPNVTITGIAKVGEVLTATVTDENGVPSNINYQWYADGEVILDATAETYVLRESEAGKGITVKAQFTDNDGHVESVISSASELVVSVIDLTFNNIGIQGGANFGVGITDNLPDGMSELEGTRTLGHDNYGNYQYSDGSIMCWIPKFYYRWGGSDSPYAAEYGLNSCDVKSKYDFADEAEANAAGYALHRAFYDDGQIKDGFFVDKYQASNNGGIASSIKNGIPLSTSRLNAPLGSLTGSPENMYAGAIDAVNTRGSDFFVTTLFVQRALSLLSMAHAQAATSTDNCAWYDATGVANYPKGNNNDALGDVNDATVKYTATGYLKAGKTGSALPFAKTTHNGQSNGVADLNGNMYEICLGVTQMSGTFYALKTSAKASALTSGATTASDAWGAAGLAANYESLGASIGALTGASRSLEMGNGTQQVFSSATTGKDWQASCAGIPLSTGVNSAGTDLFGHDRFHDSRVDDMCLFSGGNWHDGALSGVWYVRFNTSRASSNFDVGVRAALYVA